MEQTLSPEIAAAKFPKGKTVGAWFNKEDLVALYKGIFANPGETEGNYAKEAILQRLRREGFLADDRRGLVAARASELAERFGDEALEAWLDEFNQRQLAAPAEGKR